MRGLRPLPSDCPTHHPPWEPPAKWETRRQEWGDTPQLVPGTLAPQTTETPPHGVTGQQAHLGLPLLLDLS